ncbi:hypothetical protein QBC35DRAFT_541564 [Podospora australis]|uniref:Uncharacterized protein n=1 Tax=Podospora australis TaxID=1536484 RepID=A0AAN7AE95_9PEZI|nr:hypothetical protein QBC35DRAFT_541564 [Podospora australis]
MALISLLSLLLVAATVYPSAHTTTVSAADIDSNRIKGGTPLSSGPYGLPLSSFLLQTFPSFANASYSITGYNTSLPSGQTTGTSSTLAGWELTVGVTPGISLSDAENEENGADRGRFITATTLRITPPGEVKGFDGKGWRVCLIVFTGGLSATDGTGGDCGGYLPSGCINQIQVNSVSSSDGQCQDLDSLPGACSGYFSGDGKGKAWEIVPVNGTTGDRGQMVFASGSNPGAERDEKVLEEAEKKVWPVVMTWTHFASGGEVHDSAGWMSCVRAPVKKGEEKSGAAAGGRARMGLLWFVVGVVFLVIVG